MNKKYILDKSVEGEELQGKILSKLNVSFKEGLCSANKEDPTRSRNYHWNLKNIIQPMIDRNEINDGKRSKYDDRKFRIDRFEINSKTLRVYLGLTNFYHYLEDQEMDDSMKKKYISLGEKLFDDGSAFFSRCPGVAGLIISKEGSIILGKRLNKEYQGYFNSVAGHIDYCEKLEELNLEESLKNELGEFGLTNKDIINKRLIGVFQFPNTSSDFTYIIKTKAPEEYFLSNNWKENATENEHEELIKLSSIEEINLLLNDERISLMASTRGALENLNEKDLLK